MPDIRTIQCPSGETCWADECLQAQQCMHADESPPTYTQLEEAHRNGPPGHPDTLQVRILASGEPNSAAATSLLMGLGLWDIMPPEEREAFVERGQVWDTVAGREIFELVKMAKDIPQ